MNPYEQHQEIMEQESLEMVRAGISYFNYVTDAPHWLACRRLVKKGLLKESAIANSFELPVNGKGTKRP